MDDSSSLEYVWNYTFVLQTKGQQWNLIIVTKNIVFLYN